MFSRLLNNLVDYYFEPAVRNAAINSGSIDHKVINALSDNSPEAAGILAKWIVSYSVHRLPWYFEEEDRKEVKSFPEEVACCAIDYFSEINDLKIDTVLNFRMLHDRINTLYCDKMGKPRSIISLTSKVLWCFEPTKTPIYDDYAYRSAVMLTKLRKACDPQIDSYDEQYSAGDKGFTDIPWVEGKNAKNDVWWYNEFYQCHRILFESCEEYLKYKLSMKNFDNQFEHIDTLRVFDKILWLFGNVDRDFSARIK